MKQNPEYLTRNDIERISQRIVIAYQKLPMAKQSTPNTIDPVILIRDLLRLSIDCHTLSMNGSILGLTSFGEVLVKVYDDPEHPEYFQLDGKTLLVDSKLTAKNANKGRYHFTLVHEACHQIYRMLFPNAYAHDTAERRVHCCMAHRKPTCRDWEEWRTDALASAILMPLDMVKDNMQVFGLGDRLRLLNRVFAPNEYDRFCKMADYMGVSKQALAIRLKQLGLLERDYLKDPFALVNIFPDEKEVPC